MSATLNQKNQQADGPHRPSAFALIAMLKRLPQNTIIRGIAINAQSATVIVEEWDDEVERLQVFRNISIKPE